MKNFLTATLLILSAQAQAEKLVTCLGFKPAVKLSCSVEQGTMIIFGEQEKFCGAGRDGRLTLLNSQGEVVQSVKVYDVEGPIWNGEHAELGASYRLRKGGAYAVTEMKTCTMLKR